MLYWNPWVAGAGDWPAWPGGDLDVLLADRREHVLGRREVAGLELLRVEPDLACRTLAPAEDVAVLPTPRMRVSVFLIRRVA